MLLFAVYSIDDEICIQFLGLLFYDYFYDDHFMIEMDDQNIIVYHVTIY